MGVLVNGVEIPIQVGQVWADRAGKKWEVLDVNRTLAEYPVRAHSVLLGCSCIFAHDGKYWVDATHETDHDFTRLLSGPGSEATATSTPRAVMVLDFDACGNPMTRIVRLGSEATPALPATEAPTQPDVKIEQLVAALTPLADAYDRLPVLPEKIQVTLTAAELTAAYIAVQTHRAALSGEPQAKEGLSNG